MDFQVFSEAAYLQEHQAAMQGVAMLALTSGCSRDKLTVSHSAVAFAAVHLARNGR